VGKTIPKENTTGWIDHLMITAGSENKDLAYEFLEYMIEAQTQKKVTDVTGLHARQSASCPVYDAGRSEESSSGRCRQLPEAAFISGRMCRGGPSTTDLEQVKAAQ